jgi:hypothetical protein
MTDICSSHGSLAGTPNVKTAPMKPVRGWKDNIKMYTTKIVRFCKVLKGNKMKFI